MGTSGRLSYFRERTGTYHFIFKEVMSSLKVNIAVAPGNAPIVVRTFSVSNPIVSVSFIKNDVALISKSNDILDIFQFDLPVLHGKTFNTNWMVVTLCVDGYYPNGTGAACLPCDITKNCLACTTPGTFCSTCTGVYFLTGSVCTTTCPTGFYGEPSTNLCTGCNGACATCSGPSASNCSSCPANTFLSVDTCVLTCPTGFFANTANWNCDPCHSVCVTCTAASNTSCTSCNSGVGRYLDGTICLLTCPSNKYPKPATSTCESCHTECLTCTGPLNTECTSCTGTRYFEVNACPLTCPSNNFANTSTNTCDLCHTECLTCSGSLLS